MDPIAPSTTPILVRAAQHTSEGRLFALVTCVATRGSSPGTVGAKMLVLPDGTIEGTIGGGAIEHSAIEQARAMLDSGEGPTMVHHALGPDLAMACGGDIDLFIEPVRPRRRLVIFGAGHVARATARVADEAGMRCAVVDDRPEWADASAFPDGTEIVVAAFDQAVDAIPLEPDDMVVIMTRGHAHDQHLLERLVGRPLAYLGMIGSKSKVKTIIRAMAKAGVAEDALARVTTPIGLDIGSRTPGEIAVSLVAQLVLLLRRGRRDLAPEPTAPGGAA